MPNKESFLAEIAGDISGVAGASLVGAGWLGYIEASLGIIGGIGGLVALFFSVRLNRLRYIDMQEKRNGQSNGTDA